MSQKCALKSGIGNDFFTKYIFGYLLVFLISKWLNKTIKNALPLSYVYQTCTKTIRFFKPDTTNSQILKMHFSVLIRGVAY